jgi:hypothetical protein
LEQSGLGQRERERRPRANARIENLAARDVETGRGIECDDRFAPLVGLLDEEGIPLMNVIPLTLVMPLLRYRYSEIA